MTARRFTLDAFNGFACKCGLCRRTCCRDWEVRLSKREFHDARNKKIGAQAALLARQSLHRNPDSLGDGDYGLCRMRPDGFCSLQTPDGLCAWKQQRGEHLSIACENFPYTYIDFQHDEYAFPSLSCEAIVERLLEFSAPLALQSADVELPRQHFNASIQQENFARRPLLECYPALTRFGLTLLQDRRFPLDDRMVLLANALCFIDWLERNGRIAELPHAIEKYLRTDNLQQVLGKFSQYQFGPRALLTVNGDSFARFVRMPAYTAEARRVLDGLGIALDEVQVDGQMQTRLTMADAQRFAQRQQTLADFLRQKETFLEHVMVCQYLRGMMPVTKPSVWDNFKFFNVCYALLKGMIYGSFDAPPTDTQLADAVAVLHRIYIHNYEAYQQTLDYLEQLKHVDLLSMVALAKG